MADKDIVAAINDQIQMEFFSAYLYLAMAAHFENENLGGFAHWMRMQHEEERGHAMRLFDFLIQQDARVELKTIDAPTMKFGSCLDVMKQALGHERKVTASINRLYELASKSKHYPALLELQWFITEQAEEEKSVSDVIAQLEMVGDNKAALLMMDRQLASRANTD